LSDELLEWIQVASILIATISAIASWRAVKLATKQLRLNEDEKMLKIKPFFRIESIHRLQDGYFLEIKSVGHPFYYIKNVEFTGEGVKIKDQFNGEVGKDKETRRDSLVINTKVEDDSNTSGVFIMTVLDIEGNEYLQQTPVFDIENGEIKNGLKIHKQYFRDV